MRVSINPTRSNRAGNVDNLAATYLRSNEFSYVLNEVVMNDDNTIFNRRLIAGAYPFRTKGN